MSKRFAAAALTVGLGALLVPLAAAPASAHEERTLGRYHAAVGFGDEPAYAGTKNSVQLILNDTAGKPVVDLGDTLKVTVSAEAASGQTTELSLEPDFEVGEFGTPGDYRGWFIPTAPGKYTFHFTGTIKGQKVDASFTSSPTGFDEVTDPQSVEFPSKDPTTGQLAQRLDRETQRQQQALADSAAKARDDASAARTVGVIGLAVGALGLLVAVAVGLLATRARRRPARPGETATQPPTRTSRP
jgi:hypothetical protein